MLRLPKRLSTQRLLIRRWHPDDAEQLKDAIDSSLPHLREWLSWAMNEPSTLEATRFGLRLQQIEFDCGHQWLYGIFTRDESELAGGVSLLPLSSPRAFEIGYWLRSGKTGFGYATEAAGALTRIAIRLRGVDHVEIRCDPRNARSAAVARRLGYRYDCTSADGFSTGPRDRPDPMIWRISRAGSSVPRDAVAMRPRKRHSPR